MPQSSTIVFVDDEDRLPNDFLGDIHELGFESIVVNDLKSLMDAIGSNDVCLVVASAEISATESGYTICKKLRSEGKTRSLPVIITSSAHNAPEVFKQHATLPSAANGYLQLPLATFIFLDLLSQFMSFPTLQTKQHQSTRARQFEQISDNQEKQIKMLRDKLQQSTKDFDLLGKANTKLKEKNNELSQKSTEESAKHQKAQVALRSFYKDKLDGLRNTVDSLSEIQKNLNKAEEEKQELHSRLQSTIESKNDIERRLKQHRKLLTEVSAMLNDAED